jgi:hypothetical protein
MEDVMFVIKCMIVTVVLVVAMQIRVGHHTLEGHVMRWVHRSNVSETLQDVADGAIRAAHKGKDALVSAIGSSDVNDEPAPTEASTGSWFKIKRSTAYRRQKEREQERTRTDRGDESSIDNESDQD